MRVENGHNNIQQQITDFERQNPKLAEAMKVFGLTMAKYQDALNAMSLPRVYQSGSTVTKPAETRLDEYVK